MPVRQYEGPGELQIDGLTMAEAETVQVSVTGNNTEVFTMKRGLAGRSRGPVRSELTIANAIPKGGLEDAFFEKVIENADVRVTVLIAGKRYQFEGWIESIDTSQGTQEMARANLRIIAGPPLIL